MSAPAEQIEEEEPSLRDDVEAAIAEVEQQLDEPEAPPEEKVAPQAAESEAPAGETPSYPEDAEKYPTLTSEKAEKAPEGWRPAAREAWKELPEGVRREIHRRELDISSGLQGSSDARRVAERFEKLGTTYGATMAAEGFTDPLEAAEGLFKTVAGLRMGTPQQKAQQIAQIIEAYGVDINVLDNTLAGKAPSAEEAIPDALQAQLRPLQEFMQQTQARMTQVEQQQQARVATDVDTFRDSSEFIDDVRLDMADLLDMASARGREMTLQQAYDTACQMNPDVRTVLETRKASETAGVTNTRIASKEALASTVVTGKQGSVNGATPGGDLRGDIESAIADLEGR